MGWGLGVSQGLGFRVNVLGFRKIQVLKDALELTVDGLGVRSKL